MNLGDYTAAAVYGGQPSAQPVSAPASGPTHAPGSPQPVARTIQTNAADLSNPTLVLVVLTGLVIFLVHFSLRFDVGVSR